MSRKLPEKRRFSPSRLSGALHNLTPASAIASHQREVVGQACAKRMQAPACHGGHVPNVEPEKRDVYCFCT
jgi:hypothetical protein